jgi:hypothetical protein
MLLIVMLVSFPSLTTGTLLGLLVQLVTDRPISDRTERTEKEIQSSLHMYPRQFWSDAATICLVNRRACKRNAHVFFSYYFEVCIFFFSSLSLVLLVIVTMQMMMRN